MEILSAKASFLQNEYTVILRKMDEDSTRLWGKMNLQQMVEHMSDYVRIASGKTPMEIITSDEMIPRMQDFLKSEKPFRENTPNSLMSDTPVPVRNSSYNDAVTELHNELTDFFAVYRAHPETKIANPFFGMLDFDMQIQLLHKHATHHLRQFGVQA